MVNRFVYIDIYKQGTKIQIMGIPMEEPTQLRSTIYTYWKQYDTQVKGMIDSELMGGDMSKNRLMIYTTGEVPAELLGGRRQINGDIEIECTLRE